MTEGVDLADSELVGPVEVGPIAHGGGHCVARHDGRVIFVRHTLPGERVMVKITDTRHDRFWRGDAVELLAASTDRVAPTCPVAGPGGCGGCDFQHVDRAAQLRLKAAVVTEQLSRLAGLDLGVTLEEVPHPEVVDGRGWRTRMHWVADDQGRPGLRAHRSHLVVVPPHGCELASQRVPDPTHERWEPAADLWAVGGAEGAALTVGGQLVRGTAEVVEHAAGRHWAVDAAGFWQGHPGAADALVAAVLEGLEPVSGEHAFDLYCGVGLFAGALADRGVQVWGVEASRAAIRCAERNLDGLNARFSVGRVDRTLARMPRQTDLVVLDPPRSGAGRQVITTVTGLQPRAIAYVACDPAALARDVAIAARAGYRLSALRAFDLFPMTHHVECVAILTPTGTPAGPR
ncbi:MAG: class I SAM-dependent RNA methyltransferase [Propionibacteriaceae bacterium]